MPQANNGQLVTEIVGLLHPVLLHFPVALLIGGAFFAVLGFRGESPLADAAYYCLWLGAWLAILACLSGWYFAVDKNMGDWQRSFDFNKSIDVHRWGGILVAILAFVLALIACGSRRRDPYGTGAFWKLSLVLLAVLTGFVAHHGGKMTHDGLHEKLNRKTNQLYQNLTGETQAAPNPLNDDGPLNEGNNSEPPGAPGGENGKAKAGDEGNAAVSQEPAPPQGADEAADDDDPLD